MGRGLQLHHRCLDAIHAPVEDALAVLLWWHGAGAVNDGETGAELTGRTHYAKKLSGMTETAAEKDWMSPTDVRPGGSAEGDGLPASAARRAEMSSIWHCRA